MTVIQLAYDQRATTGSVFSSVLFIGLIQNRTNKKVRTDGSIFCKRKLVSETKPEMPVLSAFFTNIKTGRLINPFEKIALKVKFQPR